MTEPMQNEVITFKTIFFGVVTPTVGVIASNLDKIEQWMRIGSLAIGLAVGAFTLFVSVTNWIRKRKAQKFTRSSETETISPLVVATLLLLASACAAGPAPQKGGKIKSSLNSNDAPGYTFPGSKGQQHAASDTLETLQPENPAGPASQAQTTTEETKLILPAKTEVVETRVTPSPTPGLAPTTNETRFILSEPTPMTKSVTKEATATVGGAQKDEARTLGVKQAALRPVMLAGIALLIAAGALAYFGHWMASGIAGLIGAAMLVLFMTLPQHGLLVMGIGLAVAVVLLALVFLAYYKGKDTNKNGIPDALENLTGKLPTKS